MAVVIGDLKSYVGAEESTFDGLLQSCLDEATALVDKYVGTVEIPEVLLDRAYLEVAADLFYRRNAPGGIINQPFSVDSGVPARLPNDPMQHAYKILRRWVLPWASPESS